MAHWMCVTCGHYLQILQPPKRCPNCNQVSVFKDVTCYRPECGGETNVDPLLVGATIKTIMRTNLGAKPTTEPSLAPGSDIFNGMTQQQKDKIKKLGKAETYEQNAVICKEGDEALKLYLVEKGQVAVQSEMGKGLLVPNTIVSEGGTFGWSALVPPHKLTATVTAASKTQVLAIERGSLLALMKKDTEIGCTIMQNIAGIIALRLHNLELEMIGLLQR
jgi:CRP/FNR family transcriptional regulator, cyclic AMP receptor protein